MSPDLYDVDENQEQYHDVALSQLHGAAQAEDRPVSYHERIVCAQPALVWFAESQTLSALV